MTGSDALLAFRPPTVVARLPPRSAACPVSLRDLLAASAGSPPLPLVHAPVPGVARAALVAAKELGSPIGLELPAGQPPEPWFRAVVEAADELAPRLPLILGGTVALGTGSDEELERAYREAYRLVEAGLTHLAFQLGEVPEGSRAAALRRAAAAALEREIAVECDLPLQDGLPAPGLAAALIEELSESGLVLDAAGARFPLPRGPSEERAHVRLLADLCGWIEGTPVVRRGPVTAGLLQALAGSPARGCDDGGAALAAASARGPARADAAEAPRLSRGDRPLPPEMADLPEALAYEEVAAFLEDLGAAGSEPAVAEGLRTRLAEG